MQPSSSRRALLRSSVPVLATALAGCSSLGLGRGKLTLTALNFTPEPQRVSVQLLREDRSEQKVVFDREYELPADHAEVGHETDANVVASRPYLVRARVGDVTDHYHFHPSCAGEDGPPEELYVEVREYLDDSPNDGLYLEFNQNECGGGTDLL